MNQEIVTYIAAAFLVILWTVLVWTGHADVELVSEIKAMLVALGVVHGCTNLQRVPKDAPPTKDAP
jgi:hypothetical protein